MEGQQIQVVVNNMQYTTEQKRKKFDALPQAMKDAILSMETAEIIFQTTKKHGLGFKEAGIVADETGHVMLGLTPSNKYIVTLTGALKGVVEPDVVKLIADEINTQIFDKVRSNFKGATGAPEALAPQVQEKKEAPIPPNLPGIPKEENGLKETPIYNVGNDGMIEPAQKVTQKGDANVNSEIERELGLGGETLGEKAVATAQKTAPQPEARKVPIGTVSPTPSQEAPAVDPYREPIEP